MAIKSRGPALVLKQWREQHEKSGHRTFANGKIHTWHVHQCGGCSSKFYVLPEDHAKGQEAAGEEWVSS